MVPSGCRRARVHATAPAASSARPVRDVPAACGEGHASTELRHSPENSDLVMKPRAGVDRQPGAERASPAAGDEHDRGGGRLRGEPLGHREAVHPGQLDVQQDDLRAKAPRLRDRRRPVGRLAENLEPVGLEQRSCARPEPGVVIDDEHGPVHDSIVPRSPAAGLCERRADRVEHRHVAVDRTRR